MKILRDQDGGTAQCERLNRGDESLEGAHAAADWRDHERRIPLAGRNREQRGQKRRGVGGGDTEFCEPLVDAVETGIGAERPIEPEPARDQLGDREKGAVLRVGRASHVEHVDVGACHALPELLDKARLADAGFAPQRDEARHTRLDAAQCASSAFNSVEWPMNGVRGVIIPAAWLPGATTLNNSIGRSTPLR